MWNEESVRNCWNGKGAFPTFSSEKICPKFPEDFVPCSAEGYVVRLTNSFPYDNFGQSVAKFVRKSHVTTDQHWMEREPIPNLLKEPTDHAVAGT
jgi:hypothetical protein